MCTVNGFFLFRLWTTTAAVAATSTGNSTGTRNSDSVSVTVTESVTVPEGISGYMYSDMVFIVLEQYL